jgi:hypothetical protein
MVFFLFQSSDFLFLLLFFPKNINHLGWDWTVMLSNNNERKILIV